MFVCEVLQAVHYISYCCYCVFHSVESQTSSEIVRTMLRMSEVTTSPTASCTKPLSANEIFRSLPTSYNIPRPILDQYLTLLVDDPVGPLQRASSVLYRNDCQHVLFVPRWSLWGRLVRVEEGCTSSVSLVPRAFGQSSRI